MMEPELFQEGNILYFNINSLTVFHYICFRRCKISSYYLYFFYFTDRGLMELAEVEADHILVINLISSSSRMVEDTITILHQAIIMNQMEMVKEGLSRNSL